MDIKKIEIEKMEKNVSELTKTVMVLLNETNGKYNLAEICNSMLNVIITVIVNSCDNDEEKAKYFVNKFLFGCIDTLNNNPIQQESMDNKPNE